MNRPARVGLIDRTITDDNFTHCIRLIGACAAWAETVKEGQRLTENDMNMIALPVEMVLAFMKARVEEDSEFGEACRFALKFRSDFAAVGR